MQKKPVEVIMIVVTIFLLLFSSFIPLVIGGSINNEIKDIYFEKLAHANYDEYDPLDFDYYDEMSQRENIENTASGEIATFYKSPQTTLADGPMDSAWPMKCHDLHHTGRSPYSTADNPLTEKWRFETEGWIRGGPIIGDDGTIYFGDLNADLYAMYPNGTMKWKYITNMWIWSTPAIAEDGTVYVGSWDDYLHAVNPDGSFKWKFLASSNIVSSPAIGDDGTIYFGNTDRRIFAINPNGTEKWHYDAGSDVHCDPAIGDDGTIYIGSWDNYFYALYPNGTLKWKFETGNHVKGPASIAPDGTIYIGSWDDYLYALYPNGTMKWRHGVGEGTESNPSIGSDGTIYVGGGYLYAIYPNGTRKWTFDFGENKHSHQSSPAISADGTIYIGIIIGDHVGGEIIAINPDGTEKWRKWIGDDEVQSSPCIGSDGTVYVGSSSTTYSGASYGYLHAFNYFELEADAHGPYIGIINEPVEFTGSATGGYPPYSYHWDFGDEETSEEQNPSHEYTSAGNYTVALTVTDDNETVAVDTTWALIRESNDPPSTPNIEGETHGHYGESYEYTFVSIDLDDDDVWYYIEWGDGEVEEWIGPYSSGEEIGRSHTWDDRGEYTIRAKARDIFDAESDWGELEVTMPVNQHPFYSLFQRFLDLFPNAFPILRHLLSL